MTEPVDPFAPEGVEWTRVSPRLTNLRRVVLVGWLAVLVAGAALVVLLVDPPGSTSRWLGLLLVAAVAVGAYGWWAVERTVAAWGYAERADDLLVRRGVVFRELVVVPYGRMQFVDVETGPLQRAYGVTTVQLHTAAAATDAHIPGLPAAEAARLRDRLAALGEAQAAGL
jgi:hypothetical protein